MRKGQKLLQKIYQRGKLGYRKIGAKYGVDNTTIREIIKGKNWKYLTEKEVNDN